MGDSHTMTPSEIVDRLRRQDDSPGVRRAAADLVETLLFSERYFEKECERLNAELGVAYDRIEELGG